MPKLSRDINFKATAEMYLCNYEELLALKPLYGIPESGLHWFATYQKYHDKELETSATTVDQCVLYLHYDDHLDGLIVLQVGHSFGFGSERVL